MRRVSKVIKLVKSKVIKAEFFDFSELSHEEKELLEAARLVRKHAQSPYYHYWVGAAARSVSGRIHVGCNVERVTATQTTHAEQAAIDAMVAAEGPTKIAMIAIVAGPEGQKVDFSQKKPRPKTLSIEQASCPCGQCLQNIWENCFGDTDIEILGLTAWGEVSKITIGDALPMPFGPEDLGIDYQKLKATYPKWLFF